MPDNLTCQILNDTIDFGFSVADYTIIAYLDSAGCTPCKMKLREWSNLINRFEAVPDINVEFVMVVNSKMTEEMEHIIKRDNFLYPICFDPSGDFANSNRFLENSPYDTFLLDGSNEIALVGNPARNPKVRELYSNVIEGDIERDIKAVSMPMGAINAGDSVCMQFEVHNGETGILTVQELAPSCDCISATFKPDTIQPGKSGTLAVKYVADTIQGSTSRYIDIFFNEKENPERFIVHGYVKK